MLFNSGDAAPQQLCAIIEPQPLFNTELMKSPVLRYEMDKSGTMQIGLDTQKPR